MPKPPSPIRSTISNSCRRVPTERAFPLSPERATVRSSSDGCDMPCQALVFSKFSLPPDPEPVHSAAAVPPPKKASEACRLRARLGECLGGRRAERDQGLHRRAGELPRAHARSARQQGKPPRCESGGSEHAATDHAGVLVRHPAELGAQLAAPGFHQQWLE